MMGEASPRRVLHVQVLHHDDRLGSHQSDGALVQDDA